MWGWKGVEVSGILGHYQEVFSRVQMVKSRHLMCHFWFFGGDLLEQREIRLKLQSDAGREKERLTWSPSDVCQGWGRKQQGGDDGGTFIRVSWELTNDSRRKQTGQVADLKKILLWEEKEGGVGINGHRFLEKRWGAEARWGYSHVNNKQSGTQVP